MTSRAAAKSLKDGLKWLEGLNLAIWTHLINDRSRLIRNLNYVGFNLEEFYYSNFKDN